VLPFILADTIMSVVVIASALRIMPALKAVIKEKYA
jgi:hypothetical protein